MTLQRHEEVILRTPPAESELSSENLSAVNNQIVSH